MLLLKTIAELRSELNKKKEKKVGLVPTMGALHMGHLSLIERARAENDLVVVTIFVNPLQFAPTEDLEKYPRQLEKDCNLCETYAVDLVFAPTVEEMGIDGEQTTIVMPPSTMTEVLCGSFRPGHFQGVATIVTKLLNIVQPTTAYFGQKDAQQLAIIRRLVADLNIPVEIKNCPIVREKSGLALSSRNQYLTPKEREQASVLFRSLNKALAAFCQGENNCDKLVEIVKQELGNVPQIRIQYVELVHPLTMIPLTEIETEGLLAIACFLGSTRLIDNLMLRQPIIAIDGPAGAGKSTVTRRIAQELGLIYLDTGAMYRAVTWLVMHSGISLADEAAISALVSEAKIDLTPTHVQINGHNVTKAIRTPEVTANVSKVSAQAAVRSKLVTLQKQYGEKGGIVAEGRDIGTQVFPAAEVKIFLTATAKERARRRLEDLKNQGHSEVDLEQLVHDIEQRDYLDSTRQISPLKKAVDAVEIITDGMSIEEVTNKIISLYHLKISSKPEYEAY
ncbi:MAG: bifunctional pantoate--beta-alanine ligase/(d)CMP kinase [Gomphosphaeria aponina SAG 52.96 = DSM 107014]|uniref:Bifunctional pantoate ligase/cytidylate kinase n=1 Tax=Gomphosphaeria aponina SAG 52.96 = DSM 107014 TaxID=1521640 RepID=A0A941GSG9_9CHRO|nr:bifunctional pantoate--beta-alanine ligase/(d)CMP kinase [Gomphosphaeria aponina SAG 52.96 = DSM 107014]